MNFYLYVALNALGILAVVLSISVLLTGHDWIMSVLRREIAKNKYELKVLSIMLEGTAEIVGVESVTKDIGGESCDPL